MSVRTKWIRAFGFSVSALAVGVPYFLIPYRELNLPSALYGPGLCVLVATAALTVGCGATTFWKNVAIIGAAVPAIIVLRIAVETAADPTSHNLWPFEVIIGSIVSVLCAFTGSLIGWAISKLRVATGRSRDDRYRSISAAALGGLRIRSQPSGPSACCACSLT
jgi:hypothetical protein